MYQGKDRVFYKTLAERAAADARYEQNRLLKEQNKLIKEQQEQAERLRKEELSREAAREAQERARQAAERERMAQIAREREEAEVGEKMNTFYGNLISKYSSVMKESGIKNPSQYIIKMIEIYKEDDAEPTFLELITLNRNASLDNLLNHMNNNSKLMVEDEWGPNEDADKAKIDSIRDTIIAAKGKYKIPSIISNLIIVLFVGYLILEGINYGFDYAFETLGPFIVPFIALWIATKGILMGLRLKNIPGLVDEYNVIVRKSFVNRESKKALILEKRRLEKFDFKLEYAIFEISDAFSEFNPYLEEHNLSNLIFPSLKLRYVEYPAEFIKYCNMTNKKKTDKLKEKQKEDGLDIFDGL